jgi:hypothetical protein
MAHMRAKSASLKDEFHAQTCRPSRAKLGGREGWQAEQTEGTARRSLLERNEVDQTQAGDSDYDAGKVHLLRK